MAQLDTVNGRIGALAGGLPFGVPWATPTGGDRTASTLGAFSITATAGGGVAFYNTIGGRQAGIGSGLPLMTPWANQPATAPPALLGAFTAQSTSAPSVDNFENERVARLNLGFPVAVAFANDLETDSYEAPLILGGFPLVPSDDPTGSAIVRFRASLTTTASFGFEDIGSQVELSATASVTASGTYLGPSGRTGTGTPSWRGRVIATGTYTGPTGGTGSATLQGFSRVVAIGTYSGPIATVRTGAGTLRYSARLVAAGTFTHPGIRVGAGALQTRATVSAAGLYFNLAYAASVAIAPRFSVTAVGTYTPPPTINPAIRARRYVRIWTHFFWNR